MSRDLSLSITVPPRVRVSDDEAVRNRESRVQLAAKSIRATDANVKDLVLLSIQGQAEANGRCANQLIVEPVIRFIVCGFDAGGNGPKIIGAELVFHEHG